MGPGAGRAVAVLGAMVVALATGTTPPAVAGLLAACALILLGVLGVNQAYRAISWTTIVLIGGIIPLSGAMQTTGAAELIAQTLVNAVGNAGPYPLLIGLVLITALGQLISNTATALMVIPIAISAAAAIDVSGWGQAATTLGTTLGSVSRSWAGTGSWPSCWCRWSGGSRRATGPQPARRR